MYGFSGSEKEARVLASSSSFFSTPAGGGGLNGPRSRRAGAEAAAAATATAVRAAEWPGGGGRRCHGASTLAATGGQSRGEGGSDLGLGPWAGAKGTGLPQLV